MITVIIAALILLALSLLFIIGWGIAEAAAGWPERHRAGADDPTWAAELASVMRAANATSRAAAVAAAYDSPVLEMTDTDVFIASMHSRADAVIARLTAPLALEAASQVG